jgi:membrane-bound lytic murein transglycosylase D
MDEIRFLNPSFKLGIIPTTAESPYKLRLRKKDVGTFINNESYLYAYKTKSALSQDSMTRLMEENYREADLYTVKSGETVASIAKKFHMTTSELKSLNNLKSNTLKPKRKILVYKTPPKSSTTASSTYVPQKVPGDTTGNKSEIKDEQLPAPDETPVTRYHTVKQGETLGAIATKYHCTVKDIQTWNKLQGSVIKVGQKLKVGSSSTASTTPATTKPATTQKSQGSSSGYFYYTIKSGDNLWELADRYNVTVSQIKSLNKMQNANTLRVGQKIKIPR